MLSFTLELQLSVSKYRYLSYGICSHKQWTTILIIILGKCNSIVIAQTSEPIYTISLKQ